jgi:hypothetical protein
MDDRAFRISLAYVNAMVEPNREDDKKEPLDEKKIRELSRSALESYYPTFIQSYLRNLDITEIISLMFFITNQFGETAPQESLEKALTPLKVKILNSIGDSAMLEKGSLLDKVTAYFKENPPEAKNDIDSYVQQILGQIKNNTKRTVPKLERIISQY